MMKRFFLSILLGGCLLTNLHAVDIRVRDQQSFDRLDSDLKEALSTSPERVDVHLPREFIITGIDICISRKSELKVQ